MTSRPVGIWDTTSEKSLLLIAPTGEENEALAKACEEEGYEIIRVETATAALTEVNRRQFSVIALDAQLPDQPGYVLCRRLRQFDQRVPILMFGSGSDEADVVLALEIGADEYIVKPIRPHETVVRLRKICERAHEQAKTAPKELHFPLLDILLEPRKVIRDGREISVTSTEFDLLTYLAAHFNKVMSRENILVKVWGFDHGIETRTIDVHIFNLRKKIELTPESPQYIVTVPGIGYKFVGPRPSDVAPDDVVRLIKSQ